MSAVQELRLRRRAQAGSAAPPFITPGTGSEAARLVALQQAGLAPLRQSADAELKKAKAAFEAARGVSWTAFITVPLFVLSKIADYRRWRPISDLIGQADASLEAGDKAESDDEKRRSYSAAWTTARSAQAAILRESGDGKTGVLDILKEESTAAGVDPERVKDAARQAGQSLTGAADRLGSALKGVAVLAGLYGAYKVLGGRRG